MVSRQERARHDQVRTPNRLYLPPSRFTYIHNSRSNILRDPARLRDIISNPEFVEYFGEASPDPEGERRNIFGMEDELKVVPKGIDKAHRCGA